MCAEPRDARRDAVCLCVFTVALSCHLGVYPFMGIGHKEKLGTAGKTGQSISAGTSCLGAAGPLQLPAKGTLP